jgi:hypothetical protein
LLDDKGRRNGAPAKTTEPAMSWKPQVFVEGKWAGNALVFATKEEAEQNGRDLLMRWFVPTDSRAIESTDPVNYSYVNGRLERVEVAP